MRDDKSEVGDFVTALKYRDIYRRLNQLTWSVRESESKFDLKTQTEELLLIYQDFAKQLTIIARDIRDLDKPSAYDK